jgi:hypothetical protein
MPLESLKAMTETLYSCWSQVCCQLPLPEYADYIVVPSPGITGEIVTPYGIIDWSSIICARGNWELQGEINAPKGAVSVYRNQVSAEQRDFSSATEWIRLCGETR